MKKAYQTSSLGVPLKHLGVRKFTEMEWDRLMEWYKSRKVKIRWVPVKEEKPPKRTRRKPDVIEKLKQDDIEKIRKFDLETRAQEIVDKEFPSEEISEVKLNNQE